MLHIDSLDKICSRYFATVTKVPFTWQRKQYLPKVLKVSPLLLRDYTCPPGCGGCCFKFSLDYLPKEVKPLGVKRRQVSFDGREVVIFTDWQESNAGTRCCHLEGSLGRCGIYKERPFTCDFELIRTLQSEEENRPGVLTQKLFGRGWSYPRIDGGKGALCEMRPVSSASVAEVVRKLKRLRDWADHFGIDTWVEDILGLIDKGILQQAKGPVVLYPGDHRKMSGFGL